VWHETAFVSALLISTIGNSQDSVDAGHQPWLLSAESVAIAYAQGELHLFAPMRRQWGWVPTRSAPTTASWRPPCTWPSRCAATTACGS
jgi:hypothetical protein